MIEIHLKVFKADLIITLLFCRQTAYVVYGAFPCLSLTILSSIKRLYWKTNTKVGTTTFLMGIKF